jgi:dipeptidase
MCDTICAPGSGGMVFAKNSDRPRGEVQLSVPFGRRASAGCTLRTQYLSIGDTGAHATFLSCPTWLWGAEHGVNEFGVAIGNERVDTVREARPGRPGLIGMDLVRLGLERARTAAEALEVMAELLTVHGQGGIADATHQESYDSSFLIADPQEAYVLDTAGTSFAAAPRHGGAAISNRLSVEAGWTVASPDLLSGEDFGRFGPRGPGRADATARVAASAALIEAARAAPGGLEAAATAAHLRDHGTGPWGHPADPSAAAKRLPRAGAEGERPGTICMHRARSVTAASLIAVLPQNLAAGEPLRTYVAPGSPCASIFVPAFPRTASGPPPFVPFELSTETMWRAADAVRARVETDPDALEAVRAVLHPVELALWAEADEVVDQPHRWGDVGASWGERALHALRAAA